MISVIVPFYNIKPYFRKCLESIRVQSYKNYEVIMIDDGSTDGSSVIAEEYTKIDKRFKLYKQSNRGLSGARNSGLRLAQGDYIIFIDSDDWAEPEFFEKLVMSVENEGSDMACCRLRYVTPEGYRTTYGFNYTCKVLASGIIEDALYVKNIHTPVWAKIYKRSLIQINKISFPEGLVNEDAYFTSIISLYTKKVSFVNEILFNSLERPGSISRSSQQRLIKDMHIVLTKVQKYIVNNNFWTHSVQTAFRSRYVKGMLYNLLQAAQRMEYSKFLDINLLCRQETNYIKYDINDINLSIKHKILFALSKYPLIFYKFVKLLNKCGFKMH